MNPIAKLFRTKVIDEAAIKAFLDKVVNEILVSLDIPDDPEFYDKVFTFTLKHPITIGNDPKKSALAYIEKFRDEILSAAGIKESKLRESFSDTKKELIKNMRDISNARVYGKISLDIWKKAIKGFKDSIINLRSSQLPVSDLVAAFNVIFPMFKMSESVGKDGKWALDLVELTE